MIRQALEAARMVSSDPAMHEQTLREVLQWTSNLDFDESPPMMGQRIHRYVRQVAAVSDPYRAAKVRLNRMALAFMPELRDLISGASDPLATAVRLAIAGNVIDMGVNGDVTEADVRGSINEALAETFAGDINLFRQAVEEARDILYLADNAGEIVFDRLLIEQLAPQRVTVVVRGAPIINDATIVDARAAGLDQITEVIDNGSDAPGTVLVDCSEDFRRRFTEADLIIAKGQGNFETLSDEDRNITFLFKAKCPVIAAHVDVPVGTHVMVARAAEIPR
jgi:uncharacterized protein with ATP-grasp and redox domains